MPFIALLLSACTTPLSHYDIKDQPLSCDEANRTAYEALRAMGFQITTFEAAVPGRDGVLRGTSNEGGEERSATVSIECTPTGANVNASEDNKWLRQLEFKNGYYLNFQAQLALAERQREQAAKKASGELAASQQRNDLQVTVEPIVGLAAKLDFDLDLAAGGVLPMKIAVRNPTDRTYQLDPDQIRLTRTDRERVEPISPDTAAARMVAARVSGKNEPVTPLSQAAIADRLRLHLLPAEKLRPGAEVKGYVFFPTGDYTRARVVLTEEETEESEGFVVEFVR